MFENINAYAETLRRQHGTSLLNKHIVAKELSVSRATIDRMRTNGQIRSQRIGKQVRFHVTEVARLAMGGAL